MVAAALDEAECIVVDDVRGPSTEAMVRIPPEVESCPRPSVQCTKLLGPLSNRPSPK